MFFYASLFAWLINSNCPFLFFFMFCFCFCLIFFVFVVVVVVFFFFCCFVWQQFAIRCIYSWFDQFKICKMVGYRPVRAFGWSGIWEIFARRAIRNPANFSCGIRILGFGIRITAQGIRILLRIGIWNSSLTARESGIQYRNSES